jgi:hypothetical protein
MPGSIRQSCPASVRLFGVQTGDADETFARPAGAVAAARWAGGWMKGAAPRLEAEKRRTETT